MSVSPDVPEAGWIRAARDAAGISSYELARRAGVSQPTVVNWERRERSGAITLASLRRAAKALDTDLAYELVPREARKERTPRSESPPKGKAASRAVSTEEPAPAPAEASSFDPNSIWE